MSYPSFRAGYTSQGNMITLTDIDMISIVKWPVATTNLTGCWKASGWWKVWHTTELFHATAEEALIGLIGLIQLTVVEHRKDRPWFMWDWDYLKGEWRKNYSNFSGGYSTREGAMDLLHINPIDWKTDGCGGVVYYGVSGNKYWVNQLEDVNAKS